MQETTCEKNWSTTIKQRCLSWLGHLYRLPENTPAHQALMESLKPIKQGLRGSSLQLSSQLEFNTIFRDGFPLRVELNGWSKIRDPVTAKFKHVTVIVTCTLLCCDDVTYMPALWNLQKADLKPYPYGKKYTTFSFPIQGALASNICPRYAPKCSCIQLYT